MHQKSAMDNVLAHEIHLKRETFRHRQPRHEFETRLPPGSLAGSGRGFAFCVADPVGSAHEFSQTG